MAISMDVTPEVEKNLKKVGQANCISKKDYEAALSKFASPQGKVEVKGHGFFGVDLGSGSRALFYTDTAGNPVMFYLGDHKGYDKYSTRIRTDTARLLDDLRAKPHHTVDLPKSGSYQVSADEFSARFRESAGMKTQHGSHAHIKAGIAGVAMAGMSGIAAAAEPGATLGTVGTALADGFIPGWQAARQGDACGAFGDVAGVAASGVVVTAGAPVVAAGAVATGPAAPVVGMAGAGLLAGATTVTYDTVSEGATNACRAGVRLWDATMNKLGF
jgi:hypothetical protein